MLKHFLQWLRAHERSPSFGPDGSNLASEAAMPPGSPLKSPMPGCRVEPAERLSALSNAALNAQRQRLDCQQRETFNELEGLQADSQGIVARYARARLRGRPTELQALERNYDNLETRLRNTELRHADQLRLLKLLDRVCALHEDARARESLSLATLGGQTLENLESMLCQELAAMVGDRKKVIDLLDEIASVDQDVEFQAVAEMRPVRERLMALTEADVKQGLNETLDPLDSLANRMEQRLTERQARYLGTGRGDRDGDGEVEDAR